MSDVKEELLAAKLDLTRALDTVDRITAKANSELLTGTASTLYNSCLLPEAVEYMLMAQSRLEEFEKLI